MQTELKMEQSFSQTKLSPYRSISKLDAGGLGDAYLALDTQLGPD
jgi:hypothetical protein